NQLRFMEIDTGLLADELFSAYLKQLLVDGLFHADPHPGNVFLTDDDRIALLDLGMVGRVTRTFQDNLLRLLLAISEGRGEMAAQAAMRMGEPKEGFERSSFERRITDLVSEHGDAVLSRADAGKVTLEITKISADCWFRLPAEFTMFAKALLNLDRVVYTLDPNFDPNVVIRDRANEILQRNILKSVTPTNLLSGVVDLKEFAEKLPTRVNRIVGAAMLMRVETSFRIFGYPGLAMIFFLLAAAAGLILAFNILYYDEKRRP